MTACALCAGDLSAGDKARKGVKRKKIPEENGETAKRRSARVRNTKCKKEEKVDFQELLLKFLPPRYSHAFSDLQAPTSAYPPAFLLHCGLSSTSCFPMTSCQWPRHGSPWVGLSVFLVLLLGAS